MTTTNNAIGVSLDLYSPETVQAETVHEWEAISRRGIPSLRVYVLHHSTPDCPTARQAEGIGALTAAQDNPEGWPCSDCFILSPSTPEGGHRIESPDQEVEPGRNTAPVSSPTRRNRYAGSCADCGEQVEAEAGSLTKEDDEWKVRHHGGCPAAIVASKPAQGRSKGLDGSGGTRPTESTKPARSLDLGDLPEGRYAVPDGSTRLKVRISKPTEGRWAGFIFVKDASEYGVGERYGQQRPGGAYGGGIIDELEAILADPRAASTRYGLLVGRCGVCNRHLEDEASVAEGIGPVCASRLGW